MKISFILPTKVLLGGKYPKTKYHLVLAPLVLADSVYAKYYAERASNGDEILLDNGAWEAKTLDVPQLLEAARKVHARTIVAPDVYMDRMATLQAVTAALPRLAADWPGKLMVVPQGNDASEWRKSARRLAQEEFHFWGVPKATSKVFENCGKRAEAIRTLLEVDPQHRPMHLLGVWDNPIEILEVASNPVFSRYLYGVDTKLFYRLSLAGIFLDPERGLVNGAKPPQTHLCFDDPDPSGHIARALHWNIQCGIAWANGKSPSATLGVC